MMVLSRHVLIAGALASTVLTGCVRIPLAAPQASMANLQAARTGVAKPLQVGPFALAPGLAAEVDQHVTARGSVLSSPVDGSMSAYLREVLITELKAADKFDAQSSLVITGLLTRSELDASIGTGRGALGARFTVKSPTQTVYDRELTVEHQWESHFMGAVAIPGAFNEYNSLMTKLVGKLLADPDFQRSVR